MNQKIVPLCAGVITLSVLLCAAIYAWIEPTTTPPNGSVAAPINTGSTPQTKNGPLTVNGYMTANTGFCIGADCITAWSNIGGPWTTLGNNIYNKNSGNVGIGTANPAGKLSVQGDANGTSRASQIYVTGNTNPNQKLYIGINTNNGATSGDYASIEYLQEMQHWGNLALQADGGNVGIGTTSPGAKLEVSGQIKITGGTPGSGKVLTSNADGLATWEVPTSATMSDFDCGTNGYVTGIKNGKLICGDKGTFDPSVPCSSGALGGPNKRIFVTSSTYDASTFVTSINSNVYTSSENIADAKCQDAANIASMTAKSSTNGVSGPVFKAITFMGSRNISSVFPSAKLWSCDANSASHWKLVANDMSDMFDANGLANRIYTQYGAASTSDVWTNFESSGAGGYTIIPQPWYYAPANRNYSSYGWAGGCWLGATGGWFNCGGWNCVSGAEAWFGKADQSGAGWAHYSGFLVKDVSPYNLAPTWNACIASPSKALYCVEQ
jgi:hypothetical protein